MIFRLFFANPTLKSDFSGGKNLQNQLKVKEGLGNKLREMSFSEFFELIYIKKLLKSSRQLSFYAVICFSYQGLYLHKRLIFPWVAVSGLQLNE